MSSSFMSFNFRGGSPVIYNIGNKHGRVACLVSFRVKSQDQRANGECLCQRPINATSKAGHIKVSFRREEKHT